VNIRSQGRHLDPESTIQEPGAEKPISNLMQRRSGGGNKLWGITAGAAVGVALLAAAMVTAVAGSTSEVTAGASDLLAANAAAGASGIARAALAQAVVFVADHRISVAGADDAAAALAEARSTLDDFEKSASSFESTDPELAAAAERFSDAELATLAHLEAGRVTKAESLRSGELEPAYRALSELLEERQAGASDAMLATNSSVARLAFFTRMGATLIIPSVAMAVYWILTRRRIRAKEDEMQAQVEAERAIGHAKDELIAGISHELRTPLTSIHGFAEVLLASGIDDQSAALELISIIHSESWELSRMVDDLLTAARIDAEALSVAIEPTSLDEAITAVVAPLGLSGRAVEVVCDEVGVAADPLRLRQVLRNLISNAQRHGGPNIAVMTERERDHVTVIVADDGPGVPADAVDRLFDRFVNGGRDALLTGSVGLGLAVARQLVELMDGTLTYVRQDGITLFTITLPASIAPSRPVQLASAS
jgi:signal transduction histidine kinase